MVAKLLIANRGEIAARICSTAKKMGIRTVAVFSDADADAPYVRRADEAVHIGSAAATQSYLRIDKIIDAAKTSGADAIHPGYGFLSENPGLARAAEEAGIVFVGPPVSAIELMADKAAAKRAMIEAHVPCLPGHHGEDDSDATLLDAAAKVGFPLMVKAAAGGGGRGMRLVHQADDLPAALELARAEAADAFGRGDLILERALLSPRHIEVQVFADGHGTVLHLGERDCSTQRRHQKVIEEAPGPTVTPELRAALGRAAVDAARAIDYRGAGTVEFLVDEDRSFYFLEMNTRLQVEHPVTEMITGLDLVEQQLRVARGERLEFGQQDVVLSGHAIEVRLYAEDPSAGFMPAAGRVALWRTPSGPHLRVDAAMASGTVVPNEYDPLLAKIVAHGQTREEARRRLIDALRGTAVLGIETNRSFLIDALAHEAFIAGPTTDFLPRCFGATPTPTPPTPAMVAAAVAVHQAQQWSVWGGAVDPELRGWSSTQDLETRATYAVGQSRSGTSVDGQAYAAHVRPAPGDRYTISIDDRAWSVRVVLPGPHDAQVEVDGHRMMLVFAATSRDALSFGVEGTTFTLHHRARPKGSGQDDDAPGRIEAPMHGRLVEVAVEMGQAVSRGDRVAILEAMKMRHELTAPHDGEVAEVLAGPDTQVAAGQALFTIRPNTD